MAKCITCGAELNPERAKKYNYCMLPDCQRKNLRPLTMVAVGVNKAAEQYMLLDERTRDDLASGKYHDQRRGTYGPAAPVEPADSPAGARSPSAGGRPQSAAKAPGGQSRPAAKPGPARKRTPAPRPRRNIPERLPWTKSQQKLALLYNEQGLRPDEIAAKLGISRYLVTKIILTAKNGGKILGARAQHPRLVRDLRANCSTHRLADQAEPGPLG